MTEPSTALAKAASAIGDVEEALAQFRAHIPGTSRDYGAISIQSGDIVIDGLGLRIRATPRIVRTNKGSFGAELRFMHIASSPPAPATEVCRFYIFPTHLNVTLREAASDTAIDATSEDAPGYLLDAVLTKACESKVFDITA